MQITIELPPDLEHDLLRQAADSNIPLQTVILQALRQTIRTAPDATAQWPESVLAHESAPDFPPLESYRDELLTPPDLELF